MRPTYTSAKPSIAHPGPYGFYFALLSAASCRILGYYN